MVRMHRWFASLLLAATLTGCELPPPEPVEKTATSEAAEPATSVAVEAKATVAEAVVPTVVAIQEAIAEVAPHVPPPVQTESDELLTCATDLIRKWEIGSERLYTQRYEGFVCPGEASGPTRGIGWDDGHQTKALISEVWAAHPQLPQILPASGQVGDRKCKAFRAGALDVKTKYPYAEQVFKDSILPSYIASAKRAVPNFDELPVGFQCSLVDLGYNRGWQLSGSRRSEMREIVDVCAPNRDASCAAAQYRSMKRLWPSSKGLRDRRDDEAKIALSYGVK